MRAYDVRHSFGAGQLDAEWMARTDNERYNAGLRSGLNTEISLAGNVSRRRGWKFLDNTTVGQRLERWKFSDDQSYLLDFDVGNIRVRDPADGSVVQTLAVAWLTQPLIWELRVTIAFDTAILTHDTIQQKVLTRTGASTFAITDWRPEAAPFTGYPEYWPFHKFDEVTDVYLEPAALTGATTMTAKRRVSGAWQNVTDFWDSVDIGTVYVWNGSQFVVTSVTPGSQTANITWQQTAPGAIKIWILTHSDADKFYIGEQLIGIGKSWGGSTLAQPSNAVGELVDADSTAGHLIVRMITGTYNIRGEPSEPTGADAGDETLESLDNPGLKTYPLAIEATLAGGLGEPVYYAYPSPNWQEQAWSDRRGWPRCATFFGNRLWFGGSTQLPSYIWASKVGRYYNFDVGDALPADAISRPISTTEVRKVLHFFPGTTLQILTDSIEFYVPVLGAPITPESMDLLPFSWYGSRATIPQQMGPYTLFVERGGAVPGAWWDGEGRTYRASMVSTQANEQLSSPKQIAVQQSELSFGEQTAFVTNSDGSVAVFRAYPTSNDRSWVPWRHANGNFLSVQTLDANVYAIVDEGGTRSIQQLSSESRLDSFEILNDVGGLSVWQLDTRFADEDVAVAEFSAPSEPEPDLYLGQFTASATAELDLGAEDPTDIAVGYTPRSECYPFPLHADGQGVPVRGGPAKLIRLTLSLLDTFYLRVNNTDRFFSKIDHDEPGDVDPLDWVDVEVFQHAHGSPLEPKFDSEVPLPFTICGLRAELEVH